MSALQINSVTPFINGEEEKMQPETRKIPGSMS